MTKNLLSILIAFSSLSLCAQVLWYGDPNKDFKKSFYRLSREPGETGTVTTVNDPVYGKVWKINKPSGDKRCEFARTEGTENRYTPKEGDKIYLGWRMKINIAGGGAPGGFAVFQWKSNGPHSQNYPFAMGYEGGNSVGMSAYDAGGTCGQACKQEKLINFPVPENKWVSIVLGIKVSQNENNGYIECWVDGVKRDLNGDGADKRFKHRTLDDNGNYCKWGVYNEAVRPYNVDAYFDEMRMGTTLESVMDPLGGGGVTETFDITNVSAPASVKQGQDISLDVDYNVTTNSDLVVMFQRDEAPWTLLTQTRKSINSGIGSTTINMTIPLDAPVSTDDYQFQTFLAPAGGGWDDRLDFFQVVDVDILELEVKEPYSGTPMNIPGMLEMEYYDKGGQGVSYNDTDPENKGLDFFRPGDGVDIASKNGGRTIGYNADGEWYEYTVNIQEAGSYDMTITFASKNGGGKLGIDIDGNPTMTDVTVPSSGDWNVFTDFNQTMNLPAGEHVLRFKIETRGFDLDRVQFRKSTVTSTENIDNIIELFVYPNPSENGIFNLSDEVNYTLFDSQGLEIMSQRSSVVDLANQPKGVYLLKSGGRIIKLIK